MHHGVWNLGEEEEIQYANLEGDAYLDQWQELVGGNLLQHLNSSQNIIVYSGNDTVRLKEAKVTPALFTVQPPGNYDDWHLLHTLLTTNQGSSPTDFIEMME